MDAEVLPVPRGYEVRELLGQGRSSLVYRAWQSQPGRPVALKVGRTPGPARGAPARLDHPHIVPVYEAGEHEGRPFLCMGLVEGRSLARLLRQGPLDPRVAAWLMARVGRAVHHAHQRGVCHGRLSPAKVLLDTTGLPHVTGFGLPRRAPAGAPAPGPTDDLQALGTLLLTCLLGLAGPDRRWSPTPVDPDLSLLSHTYRNGTPGPGLLSALALAEDLERWLAGQPARARRVTPTDRLWRWLPGGPR
jgi:serine/threonine protein kinase